MSLSSDTDTNIGWVKQAERVMAKKNEKKYEKENTTAMVLWIIDEESDFVLFIKR